MTDAIRRRGRDDEGIWSDHANGIALGHRRHERWNHLAGQRDSTAAMWAILMFQAWLRAQANVSALAA